MFGRCWLFLDNTVGGVFVNLRQPLLEVVEAAYKALAKKFHPDSGGSIERMKAINSLSNQ
jgi:hypothetical protein